MNRFRANTSDDFYKKFVIDANGCWIWQDKLDNVKRATDVRH